MRMRALSEEGNRKADRVLKILEDKGKMLSAVLIGNNIVNLSASAVASIFADRKFGDTGVTVATAILTFIILICGEISPKTYATVKADKLALRMSALVRGLMIILTPLIFITNALSHGLLRLLRVDPNEAEKAMTEEELRVIVDVSHEEGVIEKEESEMIKNVVDFGDSRAKDIMIPRVDMTFVQVDMTYDELLEVFREDMFTRMPVYEETTDEVIGIVNMKDVLLEKNDESFSIRKILRDAFFTIESKHTSELLNEMRENKTSMAIVLDEYGATSGMVTLEDLLEEIVGEIRDEYDEGEEDEFKKLSDGEYLINAAMNLNDVNDLLETELNSEEEYDSLGGFVLEKLDHIPEEGESVEADRMRFTVEKMDNNRISEIRVVFLTDEETEETDAGEDRDTAKEEK